MDYGLIQPKPYSNYESPSILVALIVSRLGNPLKGTPKPLFQLLAPTLQL